MSWKTITDDLISDLAGLSFGEPVTHTYNPLVYARGAWNQYCKKYGRGSKEVLFLGMNPGPFGMAQTGVPFGEIAAVSGWLGISAKIGTPENEHPKRPILGFDCQRSEVSGRRLWDWAGETFGTPEAFFERFFVANYCPLVFMGETGRNVTPDKLSKAERASLFDACDQALRETVALLKPEILVGVGKFAEDRAHAALDGMDLRIGRMLHPSPASPMANRGWAEQATQNLAALDIKL